MPLDELEQPQVDTTGETETQAPDTGSEQVQTDTPQTESKPDWRVERYGQDYENNHEYWKDTASYWRDEHKKERAKRQQGSRVLEEPNGNGAQPESQDGVQDEPEFKSIKDLIQYVKKDTERTLSERERESNFKRSIQTARQEFNSEEFVKEGFPSFDDLEEEILAPLFKDVPEVKEILRRLPDAGSAAYTLAFVLKHKNPRGLRDAFASQGYEKAMNNIQARQNEAVRVKGGRSGPISGKLTAEQIQNMSTEEFDRLVARNTGRAV